MDIVSPESLTGRTTDVTLFLYASNRNIQKQIYSNADNWSAKFTPENGCRLHHYKLPTGENHEGGLNCARECKMLSASLKSHYDDELFPKLNRYDHDDYRIDNLFKYSFFGTRLGDQDAYTKKVSTIVELAYQSDGPVFIYCDRIKRKNNKITIRDLEAGFNDFKNGKGQTCFQVNVSERNTHRVNKAYIKRFTRNNWVNPQYQSVVSITHATLDATDTHVAPVFNDDRNCEGKHIKVIIANSCWKAGIDLRNIRQIHVVTPFKNRTGWKQYEQIMGRGIRRGSHDVLTQKKRNVMCFLHAYYGKKKITDESSDPFDKLKDEYSEVLKYFEEERRSWHLDRLLRASAINCVVTDDASARPSSTNVQRGVEFEEHVFNHSTKNRLNRVLCEPEVMLMENIELDGPVAYQGREVQRYMEEIRKVFMADTTPSTLSYHQLRKMVSMWETEIPDYNMTHALEEIVDHQLPMQDCYGMKGILVKDATTQLYSFIPNQKNGRGPHTMDIATRVSRKKAWAHPQSFDINRQCSGNYFLNIIFHRVIQKFILLRGTYASIFENNTMTKLRRHNLSKYIMEYVVDALPYPHMRILLGGIANYCTALRGKKDDRIVNKEKYRGILPSIPRDLKTKKSLDFDYKLNKYFSGTCVITFKDSTTKHVVLKSSLQMKNARRRLQQGEEVTALRRVTSAGKKEYRDATIIGVNTDGLEDVMYAADYFKDELTEMYKTPRRAYAARVAQALYSTWQDTMDKQCNTGYLFKRDTELYYMVFDYDVRDKPHSFTIVEVNDKEQHIPLEYTDTGDSYKGLYKERQPATSLQKKPDPQFQMYNAILHAQGVGDIRWLKHDIYVVFSGNASKLFTPSAKDDTATRAARKAPKAPAFDEILKLSQKFLAGRAKTDYPITRIFIDYFKRGAKKKTETIIKKWTDARNSMRDEQTKKDIQDQIKKGRNKEELRGVAKILGKKNFADIEYTEDNIDTLNTELNINITSKTRFDITDAYENPLTKNEKIDEFILYLTAIIMAKEMDVFRRLYEKKQ